MRISPAAGAQVDPAVAAWGDVVVAAWTAGVYEGCGGTEGIGWAWSSDGGVSWTDGGLLPLSSLPNGQPTLCSDAAGNFYAGCLTCAAQGRIAITRGRWEGNGLTWGPPSFVVAPTTEREDHPWLACDPGSGTLYLTFTRELVGLFVRVEFTRSLDGGATWSAPVVLSGDQAAGARPVVGPDGELHVVWHNFGTSQIVGRTSPDSGASFGPLFVVGDILDNRGSPPGGYGGRLRNFPGVAVDRSGGPRRGTLYVAWMDRVAGSLGPFTGWVNEVEPNDFFVNATPVAIGQDAYGEAEESEFASRFLQDLFVFEGVAGTTLQIEAWGYYPPGAQLPYAGFGYTLMCGADTANVRFAGGQTMPGFPGFPAQAPVIYTLPVTGPYYVSVDSPAFPSIPYVLRLRELQPDPASVARDARDLVLARSSDGGATWSPKVRLNDDPPRVDNLLPELAVDGFGDLHAAWYDDREDLGCGGDTHTYWTVSSDGGETFRPPQALNSLRSYWRGLYLIQHNSLVGDHLGMAVSGDRVHVLWTQLLGTGVNDGDKDIYGAVIAGGPTGIAVPVFTAEPRGAGVRLRWVVQDATGIVGFRLHRAAGESGEFSPLTDDVIAARGAGEYEHEDRGVEPGSLYRYRLEVVRVGGASEWEGPVTVRLEGPGTRLSWRAAAPNPFAQELRLVLEVPAAGRAQVRVFDVAGHEVAVLHEGPLGAGPGAFTWDGRDRQGNPVPPGVYWVRAERGADRATIKVSHMK